MRLASLAAAAILALVGCSADELPRPERTQEELIDARRVAEEQFTDDRRALFARTIARLRAEHDDYVAGRALSPPIVDFLILSGGGDWGAFGAGVLKGWGRVDRPLTRPAFDVVTGVSTGALIAPFAFLGDEELIDRIVEMYRNPREDWFQPRLLLALISGRASFGDVPGLERDISQSIDEAMLRRLVEAGSEKSGARCEYVEHRFRRDPRLGSRG